MIKFYKLLFLNTLIFSTLLVISSYSWFSMWMGLEINMMSFIPLMINSKNIFSSESALKYFIIQALASNILLFSIILNLHINPLFFNNNILMIMLNCALFMKLGAAPFHFWFPEIIMGLNWNNTLILMTWQKIAPLIMISYNFSITLFISIIIIMSSMVGSIQSLNQINLQKILAYSSINHMSWLIASLINMQIFIMYFIMYFILSINIIMILNVNKIYSLTQLFYSLNEFKYFKFIFSLNFLSMSGLPPFFSFLPKWLIINKLINNNFFMLSLLMLISTLIMIFMYIRIALPMLMINHTEMISHSKNIFKLNLFIYLTNMISFMGLMIFLILFF
nr:NADH dehydrogenase subunit 2 [Cylas formicarius]WGU49566.1 NADH dehydrogenase subunit 2 [Cylas formicarius]WGU49579.1 NADH dehydrogenase subunit 2 [Cylas formicarius]WGU49592.1 NADH dehydrogenase subunit 2 [Cylas formicarius]WGU49605.1 NADH dehydrogenase subunit 2 [Cylas formicarius]